MTELSQKIEQPKTASTAESILGLRDPSQWTIWEDPSRRDDQGKPLQIHRIRDDIPIPVEQGMLPLEGATVAKKNFYDSRGKEITFRLMIGWPGSRNGEVSIFQEKPEGEKMADEKGKLCGVAWGPNFASAEEAYDFLRKYNFSENPPEQLK